MRPDEHDALNSELITLRQDLACVRLALLERKYRADQPRVPAGYPTGGEWMTDGGYFADAVRRTIRRTPIDLEAEEKSGSSHAIRDHVAKTNSELKQAILDKDLNGLAFSFKDDDPQGSFDSIDAATRSANAALSVKSDQVDQVAAGAYGDANVLISTRLGVVTGREAYREDGDDSDTILFRPTFGVGVVIRRANNSNGFIIRTAFPMNLKSDRM